MNRAPMKAAGVWPAAAALCLALLFGARGGRAQQPRAALDAFGGSTAVKGQARGFFSLHQVGGRWWLITPDGGGFASIGIVHLRQGANILKAKYGDDRRKYVADAVADVKAWGFNTAGYGSTYKDDVAAGEGLPFLVSIEVLSTSRWQPGAAYHCDDVFDPSWQKKAADEIASFCRPAKDSRNLIGYYTTDVPRWGRRPGQPGWPEFFRSLPASAPGKKRYVAFLIERLGSAAKVGERYGIAAASSAADLESAAGWKAPEDDPNVRADDDAFLGVIAAEYYRVCAESIRKIDPDHLYFGDRYAESDIPAPVLAAALPYVDAIAVQTGFSLQTRRAFDRAGFDSLYARAKKPILICDYAVDFPTPEHPNVMWDAGARTEEEAAGIYERYLNAAFETPYVVGVHRCQLVDEARPNLLKQGLIRADGTPYAATVRLYTDIHRRLYAKLYRDGAAAAAAAGK